MLSSTAIVSLACLLSTGEVDSAKVVEGLSQQELAVIQSLAENGACQSLPESFDRLIQKQINGMSHPSPTSDYRASVNESPKIEYASFTSGPTSDF